MIRVCENKKDILQNGQEKPLEERVGRIRVGVSHVIDELYAHDQSSAFDFSVVMFASPHARVDYELELSGVKLEKCGEAVKVDRFQQLEELDTVLRVFREVFVDHLQCTLKDILHDSGHFVLH